MNCKDKILYVLTILSFSSINFLNVSYSFVKRFIETDFEMTSTEIGIADGLKFFGTIVGLFFYISFDLVKKDKISLFYCLSIVVNGVSIGFIPFLSMLQLNSKWTVFLFNFLGGISKAPSWPLLLQLVKQTIFNDQRNKEKFISGQFDGQNPRQSAKNQQKPETKKKSFIIWTSLTLLGNIFGLVIQQNLVYKFGLRWELCLMLPVVCIFFSSVTLGFFYDLVYAPKQQITQSGFKQDFQVLSYNLRDKSLVLECLKLLILTKNCLFTWSLVLILSIHSVMMMFLPLFLYKIGYHEYEGYILGWYNICVVLGTLFFTCVDFDKFLIMPKNEPQFADDQEIVQQIEDIQLDQNQEQNQCSFETANLISLFLLLGTCIFLVNLPCPYSCSEVLIIGEMNPQDLDNSYKLLQYFAVIGLLGFFLGGPMNKLESSEFISVLKQYQPLVKQSQISINEDLSANNNDGSMNNRVSRIFIGTVQILSYLTVMIFLISTGRIIETNILVFFYLIAVLSAFIFILNIIKILEKNFRNDD